jgi:hypothetical protein
MPGYFMKSACDHFSRDEDLGSLTTWIATSTIQDHPEAARGRQSAEFVRDHLL